MIEITVKHATMTETLTEAWEFVMARIDLVGPDASVSIDPVFSEEGRSYEVAVQGMRIEE